jgi:hypothetical protein
MIRTHSCTTHADTNVVHTHHGIPLANATPQQHACSMHAASLLEQPIVGTGLSTARNGGEKGTQGKQAK